MNKIYQLLLFFLFAFSSLHAQEILTGDAAVQITLENNYGIKLAKNATVVAQNNTSKYNTGDLPTVRVNSGTNYGVGGSEINYHDEFTPAVSNWVSNGIDYNASISSSYLLYDFKGRKINKSKLKEALNQAKLEERKAIELNILAVLASYYNIAQLQENLFAQEEVLVISKERKQRADFQFEYGKSNKLAVLNAEVDINRDSIDYLNIQQQLDNEKRDLNLLLGRDVSTSFDIDTNVIFKEELNFEQLLNEALVNNVDLILIENDKKISQLDLEINNTALKPQIYASSSLGLFGGLNDTNNRVKNQFASDFSAGLSLSWNLFDGGSSKVRKDNIKILLQNQDLILEQSRESLRKELQNSWASYQNQLYIMQVETANMQTADLNFERTQDQFKLGQLSSVEFRQAQLNKLYAKLNYNRAKFIAKVNEIRLMQLSGNLSEF